MSRPQLGRSALVTAFGRSTASLRRIVVQCCCVPPSSAPSPAQRQYLLMQALGQCIFGSNRLARNQPDPRPEAAEEALSRVTTEEAAPQPLQCHRDDRYRVAFQNPRDAGTKHIHLAIGGQLALREDTHHLPRPQILGNTLEGSLVHCLIFLTTGNRDRTGGAENKVEHRQLYVEEAEAILEYAPAYADKYGISEEQARKELAQQALRQVDQKWSEQDYIKENPRARAELAGIAREIGQVYESPTDRNIIDILVDTESSTAFQAKDEVTFNDTDINAKEVSEIERGVITDGRVESDFYARYATEHGEKPIDISLGDSVSQAVDDTLQSFEQISDRVSEDPIGLLKDTGQGLIDGAVDMLTHPEQLVLSDSRGSAEDRQLVAELQGDATAAQNEAADSLMETVSDTLAPGVGRIVKNAAGEVVEEAGEQAAKQALSKADDVVRMAGDTDGEMIGQNGPTYTAVNEPKADFYVGVDGPEDTLPATGYRYDRYKNDDGTDNKWGQQTLETQEGRATYIGFDKYDTGKDARNAFQVKGPEHVDSTNPKDSSWSDGRIRSEFDTLQLYENGKPQARVPDRLGDTQKGAPEPITEAYPEYGSGGAHQLHVDGKILQYDRSEVIPEK